jgi:hypothetical protein
MQASSTSPHRSTSWWGVVVQQLEQNAGAVMLGAGAVALLLIVSFIGVLQGAVQRGEMKRAQQNLAVSAAATVAPVVVVARSGR